MWAYFFIKKTKKMNFGSKATAMKPFLVRNFCLYKEACMDVTRLSKLSPLRFRSFSSSIPSLDSVPSSNPHFAFLQKMYEKAPINGLFNKHLIEYSLEGDTSITFVPEKKHCHTAMGLHGSGYFKLLDDAAWFSAQAQVEDFFIYTVSFNTYLIRPVSPGSKLYAKGKTTFKSKNLLIAESEIFTAEDHKKVASGSGTFMKGPIKLETIKQKAG